MDRLDPAEPHRLLAAQTSHRQKAGAQIRGIAVGSGSEQMDRAQVGDQPELLLADPELGHRPRQRVGSIGHLLFH
jgi:hypothetical protein